MTPIVVDRLIFEASVEQCEPAKRAIQQCGPAAFPMIKSAKSTEGKKKEGHTVGVAYLSSWGVFLFYTPISP